MRGPSVIAKNLKLLFRSRESAFTIIFGPLLIILLVSAAYTGGSEDTTIRIGTYAPEYTPLADKIITSLKEQDHMVSVFNNEADCTEPIKTGELHTCIIFPEDFRIKENASNDVIFVVDYSRQNFVYEIIEELSDEFQLQRTAITENMAGDVLQRVALAQQEIHNQLENGETLNSRLGNVSNELGEGRTALGSVDVDVKFADLKDIRGRVTGLSGMITELKEEAIDAIDTSIESLETIEPEVENETENLTTWTIDYLENASESINEIAEKAPDAVQEVSKIIDDTAQAMQKVEERYGELVSASNEADARIANANREVGEATSGLTELRGKLAHVDSTLQNVLGREASSIAAPINTKIEAINTAKSNLSFTYPYVLLLVIMFLGLMLNSSLIVMDKTSTAAFRNFTTATRDEYHILLSFITTFLILFVQTLVILLISYFFVKAPLFNNFGVSLLIIFFAITLFSFMGMIIGYLSGTQEAAMIASLSLGSILLFVSNLVLPIEAMNTVVGALSNYNPYVVLSELLKQSMLFNMKINHVPGKIGLLVVTIGVLFGLILLIQRSFKAKFFQRRSKDLATSAFAPKTRNVKPLLVGDHEIRDLFKLLEVLDSMTRAEFEAANAKGHHPIATWVRTELGEKRLAKKLKSGSKERIILALDKHIKRQTKKLAKGQ